MKRVLILSLVALVACGTPITRNDDSNIPNWVAEKFYVPERSVAAPSFENNEIAFTLAAGSCTRITDPTGPSDCATGTSRTVLATGRDWQLGYMNLLTFEVFVDADFQETGTRQPVTIARFQGADIPNLPLFDFRLDKTFGVTFLGRTCIAPEDFGTWQRVFVRLRWSDTDDGFLEVRCGGDQVHHAPVVFTKSGFPTNQSLLKDVPAAAERFSFQIGLIAEGRAVFQGVPNRQVEIKFRRLAERRLYILFNLDEQS
ncbi:MAG: hypothetical protein AAGJ34_03145 [Pseudomonadota bacterium]